MKGRETREEVAKGKGTQTTLGYKQYLVEDMECER